MPLPELQNRSVKIGWFFWPPTDKFYWGNHNRSMKAAIQTQTEHAPGSFCWVELATTDGPGAKKFYSEMFGWEAEDSPIGPDMVYTMLKLNGKDVGALYQKGEQMKQVPTHWASYISVTSADETAARAKALGATVLQEPFDVMDVGRMAVIADPTGAHFCIWQPKQHKGVGVKGELNSLCWNELLTNDTTRAIDFYTKLFGWKTKTERGATPYTEIINGDDHIGGIMQIQPQMGPMPPNWGIYIGVDDCDAKAAKAQLLGARTYVPPTDIPNVGRFAVLADPQGAVFSIIELASPQPSLRQPQDISLFNRQQTDEDSTVEPYTQELERMSTKIQEVVKEAASAEHRILKNQEQIEDLKRETRAVLTRLRTG